MNGDQQAFITPESIATYGGATLVVYVLQNTIRVLDRKPYFDDIWISFFVSLIVSFAITYINISNTQNINILSTIFFEKPLTAFFSLINACLLFLNSRGLQLSLDQPKPKGEKQGSKRRKWFDSW